MPADPASDKLLITVGAGKQSVALLSALLPKWKKIRLGVRSEASVTRLAGEFPNAEIVRADLDNIRDVERLVEGVNVIYHFGPSLHPREADLGIRVIDAAVTENRRSQGVIKHFVFSSVAGPQIRKLPNHACKSLVEEVLMESGLPYTIIQPGFRMDTFPLRAVLGQQQQKEQQKHRKEPQEADEALYAPIIYKVILEERERHFYATYQLVSTPAPIPFTEFVQRAVGTAGRKAEVSYKGFEEAIAFYMQIMFGSEEKADPEVRDGLQRTLLYYNHRGLLGSSTQLEWAGWRAFSTSYSLAGTGLHTINHAAEAAVRANTERFQKAEASASTSHVLSRTLSVELQAEEPPAPESEGQEVPALSVSQTLWNAAYDSLEEDADTAELVRAYAKTLMIASDIAPSTDLSVEVKDPIQRQIHMRKLVERGQAKISTSSKIIMGMGDVVQPILSVKPTIDAAVQNNPQAALPWAGVCIGLQDHICEPSESILAQLEARVIALYKALLLYQMKSVCSYYRHQAFQFLRALANWDDWDGHLEAVRHAEQCLLDDWGQFDKMKAGNLRSELNEREKE
ncbi:hypothetical protein VTI28DRAFT_6595 [Corynascus sepedonium]